MIQWERITSVLNNQDCYSEYQPPYFEACLSIFHASASLHCHLHLLLLGQPTCHFQPQVPHHNSHSGSLHQLEKSSAVHPKHCIC